MGTRKREENQEERRTHEFEREVVEVLRAIHDELRRDCVCHELKRLNEFVRAVKSFVLTEEGLPMGVIDGIVVGATGTITATPQPAGTSVGSVVPTWTTSDTANTSITPSADGLSVAVAVGAGAPVGGSTTVTISATSPDGTVTATGSAVVPYFESTPPPPTFPTSFDLAQTS